MTTIREAMTITARLVRQGWTWTSQTFDELLFPSYCPVCDRETGGSAFCDDCRAELLEASGQTCDRCAMPVGPYGDPSGGCSECRGEPLGFDRAFALGPYEGPIRQLCLDLKHDKHAWMARWLAELVVERHLDDLRRETGAWVVPIPLHWGRRVRRGYNQADALARGLSRSLSLRVRPILRRVKATPKLAMMARGERTQIMRQAFRARPVAGLKGRTVLLVDDILTSGATCGAAARALKQAGAARVVVVVVGRAEGKP